MKIRTIFFTAVEKCSFLKQLGVGKMYFEEEYMVVMEAKNLGGVNIVRLKSPVTGLVLHKSVRDSLNVSRFKKWDKVRVKWKMYFPGRNKRPSFLIDGIELYEKNI